MLLAPDASVGGSTTSTLTYRTVGSGPPLLLIMGINAPASAWQPHVDAWSSTFTCVLVENRGVTGSLDLVEPRTTAQLAEDYADVAVRLGLGPCAVVGISMGGAVAQELALARPDLVSRLVLVASWSRPHPYTDAVLETIAAVRRSAEDHVFARHLQSLVWSPGWFADHADELRAASREPLLVPAEALVRQVEACRSHDAHDRLGALRVPTLVTAGAADRFVPLASSRELADAVPGATFLGFATGHVHHWEELGTFNGEVARWLS